MCRITGFIDFNNISYNIKQVGTEMRDSLSHGGPDDKGEYIEHFNNGSVYLGHRRLSILDLSQSGHQPMIYQDYVIVYNGEIYNFHEIKRELEETGVTFASTSDTEVILHAYHHWGKDCVHKFRGMWSFAIWNKKSHTLILCRDRFGIKPLYWYYNNGLFIFASELKSILCHPCFNKEINLQAVSRYLQLGYIPAPLSIFKHVAKLECAHFLELSPQKEISQYKYWDSKIPIQSELTDFNDAVYEVERSLLDSFKLRMVSDVPVGIFLSGGIDSTLVTTLLQKEITNPIKTYTIGFRDQRYNEANFANELAKYLGTEHHELYCEEKDFLSIVPQIAQMYDEPFGDASSIPTHLVAKFARNDVKVCLGGDGGDELFAGYVKYQFAYHGYPILKKIPHCIRYLMYLVSETISPSVLNKISSFTPLLKNYTNVGEKFDKFRNTLMSKSIVDFFMKSSSYLSEHKINDLMNIDMDYNYIKSIIDENSNTVLSQLGMLDVNTYLPDDILVKTDRATMSVALEGRVPFLDVKLYELVMSLPDSVKYRDKQLKYILKNIIKKNIPTHLIDRPKQGFGIPVGKWLASEFEDDLQAIMVDTVFMERYALNQKSVKKYINGILSRSSNVNPNVAWFIYMLWKWDKQWMQ